MATASTLTKRDYQKLLGDLRRIIREGKEEAERAATQALIESYWAIGRRIANEKLEDLTEVGQNVEMSHITSDPLVDRSAFTHAGYGATSGFWNLSVTRSLSPMAT